MDNSALKPTQEANSARRDATDGNAILKTQECTIKFGGLTAVKAVRFHRREGNCVALGNSMVSE